MQKGTLALRCVVPRIAAVRRRDDRLHCRQKAEAHQHDETYWSCFF